MTAHRGIHARHRVPIMVQSTEVGPGVAGQRKLVPLGCTQYEWLLLVQYQWRVGDDKPRYPTGMGAVRVQIRSAGKPQALGPVPH